MSVCNLAMRLEQRIRMTMPEATGRTKPRALSTEAGHGSGAATVAQRQMPGHSEISSRGNRRHSEKSSRYMHMPEPSTDVHCCNRPDGSEK
mmetsp:Transcript_65040/g.172226  ORF Transcript_65040/g.172226 Transcript_65040/m.172226 type:complete len:91 (-) Transcript_65040:2652-2924(-)